MLTQEKKHIVVYFFLLDLLDFGTCRAAGS